MSVSTRIYTLIALVIGLVSFISPRFFTLPRAVYIILFVIGVLAVLYLAYQVFIPLKNRLGPLLTFGATRYRYVKGKGVFLGNIRNVLLRIGTFQQVLEEFINLVPHIQNANLLRNMGKGIGSRFATVFSAQVLNKPRWIGSSPGLKPVSAELLKVWNDYDGAAGFGVLDFKEFKFPADDLKMLGTIDLGKIRLHNSFLASDRDANSPNICEFMEGYVEGFLTETLREGESIEVRMTCQGKPSSHQICEFDVKLIRQ